MAEVSDKIPSYVDFGINAALAAFVIILVSAWRRWAGLVLLPISAMIIWATLDVVLDPSVGPAAVREQGSWYPVAGFGACAVVVGAHVFGWCIGEKSSSASKPGDAA